MNKFTKSISDFINTKIFADEYKALQEKCYEEEKRNVQNEFNQIQQSFNILKQEYNKLASIQFQKTVENDLNRQQDLNRELAQEQNLNQHLGYQQQQQNVEVTDTSDLGIQMNPFADWKED